MADTIYEENWKLYWCTTISDISAPTDLEIYNGTRLQKITKSGVSINTNEGVVDLGELDTFFNAQRPGGLSLTIDLTIKRDDSDESGTFDLTLRDTDGYLVISPFGLAVPTSKVHVFPSTIGERRLSTPAANDPQTYMVTLYGNAPYDLDAVVVSS